MRTLSILLLAFAIGMPGAAAQSQDKQKAKTALDEAAQKQRRILEELARILEEQKATLSDAALTAALETLLEDEKKQVEGIRDLGKRTLGKLSEELTDKDRADLKQLGDGQAACAERFQRIEKGLRIKTDQKPESPFAHAMDRAEEAKLHAKMVEAARMLAENQLGKSLRLTNETVEVLQEMVRILSQSEVDTKDSGDSSGFAVPSVSLKGEDQTLTEFKWPGAIVDTLGAILRGLRKLDELVERQQVVAVKTKTRAAKDTLADDLAKEEWQIRWEALQIAAQISLMDPKIDELVRVATATLENEAIPPMEKGPLTSAVEPAERAVKELKAAADYLREKWKEILALLKKLTMETELIFGAGMSIPHGMSQAAKEKIQKAVFMTLRAISQLTEAIKKETALVDETKTAQNLPALKPKQDELPPFLQAEVIKFLVNPEHLPGYLSDEETRADMANYHDKLKDTLKVMEQASDALGAGSRDNALKHEEGSIALMSDALRSLCKILQFLLGQFAPPGMAMGSGGMSGFALDPSLDETKGKGWLFELPEQMRKSVRQAFRGSFPRRYEGAIKRYYKAIAGEEP